MTCRLTPAYAIVIGFYSTLFEKMGSGPMWDTWIHSSKVDCRANWWTNLLYINNYVNVPNMVSCIVLSLEITIKLMTDEYLFISLQCMSQSWYLSVDMQLLWLSPIFIYPMIKYNRGIFFWTISCIGIFVSILVPFCLTYFLHLTGTMLYYKRYLIILIVSNDKGIHKKRIFIKESQLQYARCNECVFTNLHKSLHKSRALHHWTSCWLFSVQNERI